jgi:hypothetical protein
MFPTKSEIWHIPGRSKLYPILDFLGLKGGASLYQFLDSSPWTPWLGIRKQNSRPVIQGLNLSKHLVSLKPKRYKLLFFFHDTLLSQRVGEISNSSEDIIRNRKSQLRFAPFFEKTISSQSHRAFEEAFADFDGEEIRHSDTEYREEYRERKRFEAEETPE